MSPREGRARERERDTKGLGGCALARGAHVKGHKPKISFKKLGFSKFSNFFLKFQNSKIFKKKYGKSKIFKIFKKNMEIPKFSKFQKKIGSDLILKEAQTKRRTIKACCGSLFWYLFLIMFSTRFWTRFGTLLGSIWGSLLALLGVQVGQK